MIKMHLLHIIIFYVLNLDKADFLYHGVLQAPVWPVSVAVPGGAAREHRAVADSDTGMEEQVPRPQTDGQSHTHSYRGHSR